MRFLSLFSGIEAASAAWHPLGWHCVGVADIQPYACALLRQHYPGVPNLGDVLDVTEAQIAALGQFDVLVFGSPCQDLSIAGKRKGFDGERSSLFFAAMRIVQWARVHCGLRWALWENVGGAFSSNDGRDFAEVVGAMAGLPATPDVPPQGWGTEGAALGTTLLEWATLDAQWFGVPQRRKRVFALSDFGAWADRPPVLLERPSFSGDRPTQHEPEQNDAAAVGAGAAVGDGRREPVLSTSGNTSHCLNAGAMLRFDLSTETFIMEPVLVASGNAEGSTGHPYLTVSNLSKTVNNQTPLLAFAQPAPGNLVRYRVRRLTPLECERLQGFRDHYTNVTFNGKPATDTPRYIALGNTMCVKVMRWIGQSIEFAHNY